MTVGWNLCVFVVVCVWYLLRIGYLLLCLVVVGDLLFILLCVCVVVLPICAFPIHLFDILARWWILPLLTHRVTYVVTDSRIPLPVTYVGSSHFVPFTLPCPRPLPR